MHHLLLFHHGMADCRAGNRGELPRANYDSPHQHTVQTRLGSIRLGCNHATASHSHSVGCRAALQAKALNNIRSATKSISDSVMVPIEVNLDMAVEYIQVILWFASFVYLAGPSADLDEKSFDLMTRAQRGVHGTWSMYLSGHCCKMNNCYCWLVMNIPYGRRGSKTNANAHDILVGIIYFNL